MVKCYGTGFGNFVSEGRKCGLSDWVQCQQSCYYISPANDSFAATWHEVKQICYDLGAPIHLLAYRLAITDKREQTCVNNLLKSQPPGAPGYWTDLNDLKLKDQWLFDANFNNPPNYDVM